MNIHLKNFLAKHWYWVLILLLTIIGATTRLYQLGQVPHGMTWDEAAIGYNGFAMLTTRRDEWLVRFPISFQSFGDYKAPFAIYLNGIFTLLFGMNLFAVRLPFALISILGIPGIIFFTREFLQLLGFPSRRQSDLWSLFVGFMLTFSPWHFHFSRIGFESGMMLSFILWGLWCVCRLLNQSQERGQRKWVELGKPFVLMGGASTLLAASIYTYHSAKLVVPLIMVLFLLFFWKKFWQQKWWIGGAAVIGLGLLKPFIVDTLWSSGGERFTQATVAGLNISLQEKIFLVWVHFFQHFLPDFMLFGATTTLRHGDGHWGVFLPTTFFLIVCGILFGLRAFFLQTLRLDTPTKKLFVFAVLWIVIGIVPAALGRDVPHSNRAIMALPGYLFLACYGWFELITFLKGTTLNRRVSGSKGERDLLVKSIVGTWFLLHLLFTSQYLKHYFTVYAKDSAGDFSDGYLEAAHFAADQEDSSDKILFTSAYGQPYIYLLFVRQTNPIWYRGGSLIKYEFTDQIKPGDIERNKTTIVATPYEIDPKLADQVVYGSDHSIRFVLVKPKEKNP